MISSGAIMDFFNTTRGQALEAVFESLKAREETEAQWQLVESLAQKPSAALRVGAMQALLSVANVDVMDRSWNAFVALCQGEKDVLRCPYAIQFLNWAIFLRSNDALPFVFELMDDEYEEAAQMGAELACAFALRPDAIDTNLLTKLLNGPKAWRCAVAEVASRWLMATPQPALQVSLECQRLLEICFDDADDGVRREAACFSADLRPEHFQTLKVLIEYFIVSPAYKDGDHWLHEFFLNHGDWEPQWTLEQIKSILSRPDGEMGSGLGGDELARCVLHLYTLPEMVEDNTFRSQCIDAFGELLERNNSDAQKALSDWDDGRFF
jgi:hypothetical protein